MSQPYNVVSNYVVVSLLCEEFDSKASHITDSVRSTTFTGSCTQPPKDRGLLSNTVKEFCTCVFRDIIGDFEFSPRTGGFGVNDATPYQLIGIQICQEVSNSPFRNTLTIKVCKCLKKDRITECCDAAPANCRQCDTDRGI
jgi:hypothetical protein